MKNSYSSPLEKIDLENSLREQVRRVLFSPSMIEVTLPFTTEKPNDILHLSLIKQTMFTQ